ncbi:uncharacterized protein ACWYII_012593 [Salvelinus alpinus]
MDMKFQLMGLPGRRMLKSEEAIPSIFIFTSKRKASDHPTSAQKRSRPESPIPSTSAAHQHQAQHQELVVAKYTTYCLTTDDVSEIVQSELIQVPEAPSSVATEVVIGFKRALTKLVDNMGLTVDGVTIYTQDEGSLL